MYRKHLSASTCNASALQIEQQFKLARLLAGLHGTAARMEVSEMIGFVLESVPTLHLLEDRFLALVEAAQVGVCMWVGALRGT